MENIKTKIFKYFKLLSKNVIVKAVEIVIKLITKNEMKFLVTLNSYDFLQTININEK